MSNGFNTKLAGVTFENAQSYIPYLQKGDILVLKREPNNIYDANAVAVFDKSGHKLGHLSRMVAESVAPEMDRGYNYQASVTMVTGGNGYNYGVNIWLEKTYGNITSVQNSRFGGDNMSCADKFRNYLNQSDIHFEEGKLDDGGKFYRFYQSVKNGETLTFIFLFSSDDTWVDINIFNIATIESPLKRGEVLKLINSLNTTYRYPKFVVDERGEISTQTSIPIADPMNFDADAIFLVSYFCYRAIEEEYPKFMKLRWA